MQLFLNRRVLRHGLPLVLIALASQLAAAPTTAEVEAPQGLLFQAEKHVGSDSKRVDDPSAMEGQAVTNDRAWQPLVVIPTPAEGERFTV
ncbi:MAG TPA: hypothetical protein PKB10_12050, partial [Tepidisphaeraceae bacterium]|nr:hypothetical protein [Tepidisphaeraceae bacterium]